MKTSALERTTFIPSRPWLCGLVLIVLTLSLSGFAELGGTASTVQTDQARMKGTVKVTEAEAYTVHEITSPEGTVVREFVSPAGVVFAVAWRGHFRPDLQPLLGAYFTQFSQAMQGQKAGHPGHRPLNIQEPGLVVQTAGHMRSFSGRAYIPEMIPQGVGAEVIQ
jgi:hypothetical protein